MATRSKAPSGLRLVKLEPEHLKQVLEIEVVVHSAPWSESSFVNEVNHRDGVFLVALLAGKVVGYGGFWLMVDEAHVVNVATHPEHRRQGIGRKIMVELLLRAKELGARCSTLEVRAGNPAAIGLYEGLGYVQAGVRKRYYPDNREDAVVMWLHGLETWEP